MHRGLTNGAACPTYGILTNSKHMHKEEPNHKLENTGMAHWIGNDALYHLSIINTGVVVELDLHTLGKQE